MPRSSIKGQVLADLVTEFAEPSIETITDKEDMDGKSVGTISTWETLCWKVYVDGVANQRGSRIGIVLISPEGIAIEKSLRFGFSATNEAEYEALLQGMMMVQKLGRRAMEAFSDSKLVVGQVMGELEARDARMQEYLGRVKRLQLDFESFNLTHVPRSENTHADSLATLATSSAHDLPRTILVEDLCQTSSTRGKKAQVHQVRKSPSWMDPIVNFLKGDTLPKGKLEAEKIRRNAPWFWLSEDHKLYRRFYSGPYLLCIHPEESESLLEELHEGICGSHTGGRSLWGLDIVDPFPEATGNKRYIILGTDYFTKWVEAEPLANIRDVDVKKFIWKNIITRFGTPHTLISDNGLQFDSKNFREYCCEFGIINWYSTPAYPQGNGQAEAVNKVIACGLKKRLDDAKGRWVEELSHVLWTYRTTPRRSTGETPFSMTYGAEAVLPIVNSFPTLKSDAFTTDNNDELLGRSLDLAEEKREKAMIHMACYN
ncbi:uncharacterized protein LOC115952034 [Quercus lobata]|uniref:uncharacterized protein LOC115952034 n=1 Tax=Quercus lobata TaxID=97700 RepID=UPI001248D68D|nr:uncharacterized protein LOC115952034 [Quercus lobata]